MSLVCHHHLWQKDSLRIVTDNFMAISPLCHMMQHSTTGDCLPAVSVSFVWKASSYQLPWTATPSTTVTTVHAAARDVGAFDLSLCVTYECRDDDQNQEDSELHGVDDHFTLASALSWWWNSCYDSSQSILLLWDHWCGTECGYDSI